VSQISSSDAFYKYCNIRYLEKKTTIAELLIFELQFYEELTEAAKKKHSQCIKLLSDLSNTSYRSKIKKVNESLFNDFEKKNFCEPVNNPKPKEIVIEANKNLWLIKQQLEEKKAQKIVQVMDQSNISRRK
ncbi:10992_t:CDS:1, partial [Gigaspora margarita]